MSRHVIRGPFNSWVLATLDGAMHRLYAERKAKLFSSLPPTLVELGPGTGANFRYYQPRTSVVAIEPNPYMHKRLREKARRFDLELEILSVRGERLELESESVEAVVCTLVLCSVDDPEQVLEEVRRVLRPGGRFVFLEHVAAPAGTLLHTLQRTLRAPWKWCTEGCRLDRHTGRVLERAGFSTLHLETFCLPRTAGPVAPHIAGTAVR